MVLDILEFRIENQQKSLGKTVLKMRSQICEEKSYVSTKMLLEKSSKLKTTKKI